MSKRFTLYAHPRSGPSYRAGLALALMQEPFAFELIDLPNGAGQKPEYKAKNRWGQVPLLQDGDAYIAQSAAILEHLSDANGKFGGKSASERSDIRSWMFWDFDRLAPGLFRSRAYKMGFAKAEPDVVESYRTLGEGGLGVIENWLASRQWLVGDRPTIADICLYPGVHYAPVGGFDLSKYPAITAWMKRVEGLPGYGKPADVIPAASRA